MGLEKFKSDSSGREWSTKVEEAGVEFVVTIPGQYSSYEASIAYEGEETSEGMVTTISHPVGALVDDRVSSKEDLTRDVVKEAFEELVKKADEKNPVKEMQSARIYEKTTVRKGDIEWD